MRSILKFLFLIAFIENTTNASSLPHHSALIDSDNEEPIGSRHSTPFTDKRKARVIDTSDEEESDNEETIGSGHNSTVLGKRKAVIDTSDTEKSDDEEPIESEHSTPAVEKKKAKTIDTSDEEESDEEEGIADTQEARVQAFVHLVKGKRYAEINYPKTTRLGYTRIAMERGLLNESDIQELSRGLGHHFQYHDQIAELVLAKTPLDELLQFLGKQKDQQPETAIPWRKLSKDEQVHHLHLVIADLYKKHKLEPVDTDYFRARHVVIEKKGVTRSHIVSFLNDPHQETTKTIKELVDQFNQSEFRVYRSISLPAFRGHMKRLQDAKLLSERALRFIEACTGPTAPHHTRK